MANMEYLNQYEKENIRQIRLKINRKTEPELIEWIEKQENIQGYIKRLIREDMERTTKEERKMKANGKSYKIKDEYLDLWGEDATEDTIITEEELEMITRGWDKKPEDVMDQLIPLE